MKNNFTAVMFLILLLAYGTSSCTSKSSHASTQTDTQCITNHVIAADVLESLKQGNQRFCSGKLSHNHQDLERIKELATGQSPQAVIITCSDSRVPPEIIFDQGLGDLFTIRTAGNVMGDYEEGSVEYAAEHLHSKLIVVMGHKSCGAVSAMLEYCEHADHNHLAKSDDVTRDHISSIINALMDEEEANEALCDQNDKCTAMVRANVIHGVKQLRNSKPILSHMNEKGEIKVVGAIYDLETGKVEFLDI